jgi:hypothetical protein
MLLSSLAYGKILFAARIWPDLCFDWGLTHYQGGGTGVLRDALLQVLNWRSLHLRLKLHTYALNLSLCYPCYL